MDGDAIRRWWQAQVRMWEALHRANAPWEQEGPLRWRRRLWSGWELQGSTLPTDDPAMW